jgi:hypothetical protein
MFRFHALVEKHSDELSRLVVAENGTYTNLCWKALELILF